MYFLKVSRRDLLNVVEQQQKILWGMYLEPPAAKSPTPLATAAEKKY